MSSSVDSGHTGQDQRRDRRFQVAQPAIISQPGQKDITCEIRDFCLGGLFLKFTNPEAAITALAKLEGAEVEIVFTPATLDPKQTFRLQAQLKRLSPLGVGVGFARQPVEALRALQKLRMASHRQRLASTPATAANERLRETCTTLLRETIMQTQDLMSRLIEDKLATAALHAAGIAEHSGLLNAPLEFKAHTMAIQTKFIQGVLDVFSHAKQSPAMKSAETDGALSLVDELDFEDWLSTSSEVTKLEEHFRDQLTDIEPRVAQLFAAPYDHTNNPFGPSVICHAYRNAIQEMSVLAKARTVAYAALREVLTDQLAPLYAELLSLLPVSEAEIADRAPVSHAHHAQNPALSAQDMEGVGSQQVQPGASQTPHSGSQGALGRLTGSLMDFFRRDTGNSAIPRPQPAQFVPQPGQHSPQAPGQAAPQPGQAYAPAPQAPMPTGQYIGQHNGLAPSQVLQRLSATGAIPQNLTQEMQHSVDMFGALFDTMHAEKSISEGMRPFFSQLETSLIKLAVSDPTFLSSPYHPAHKVLNTLDRISMMAGDEGKITDERLLRLMNRWTDRINAEAEKNPGVFEEARTQLERVVKPLLNERTARISRLQEICEGRQRAELTKRRVLTELLGRMGERSIPNVVIELINGGWRNILLMAELRQGEDSAEAKAAWQALEQLSEWLDPARTELPPATDAQYLLQYIDTALTQVCADKFAQDRILDQLAAVLFDQDKSQYEYTTVSAKLRDMPTETLTAGQGTLVERLRVGDWLQFSNLEAPLNLIWVGDRPPVYVFANYRGIKKLDIKRQDLLQTLEKNEAQWTADLELPLMDRSYSAMIQKMQRDLLWQSSHDPVTGFSNRKSFFRSIRRNWLRSKDAATGYAIGIIQVDMLDHAGKTPNADTRNPFMRDFAPFVQKQLPGDSLLARAGEQSIAFWIESPNADSAKLTSETLLKDLNQYSQPVDGHDYRASTHIGLIWSTDCLDPESYYDNANAACASARESGQDAIILFRNDNPDQPNAVIELAQWAHELTRILSENRLELTCQSVVDIRNSEPVHYEVLLNSVSDTDKRISTRDLITVAERLQRITEVDRWVVKQVFQWMRDHTDRMDTIGGFSINLSGQSVVNPLFLNFLLSELGRGDLPGEKIIFEIAETAAVEGHSQAQLFIRQLQRFGCKFLLDEFGIGTSAYTTLKSLKLDYLKIDRSLVREISTSLIDEALVRSILETSSFLGIDTIAGFVEDEETLTKLREFGIHYAQGYAISKPVPLANLLKVD